MKELAAIALAYFAVVAGIALFQRSFIYPAPATQAQLPSEYLPIVLRTADGLDLAAVYRPATDDRPTVVFFHGNGDNLGGAAAATAGLAEAGFGILLPEYRGYAGNPGSPSEAGLYEDGRAALAWLEQQGIPADRVVIVGNSIGSGVATQMALEHDPAALVLVSPFTSLPGLAGEKIWWAPASLLVRDRFDNLGKLGRIDAPVLLMHGTADSLISSRHSEILAAANPRARLVLIEGVGHELAYRRETQASALRWLAEILPHQDRL